jgi:hypothetical protein
MQLGDRARQKPVGGGLQRAPECRRHHRGRDRMFSAATASGSRCEGNSGASGCSGSSPHLGQPGNPRMLLVATRASEPKASGAVHRDGG